MRARDWLESLSEVDLERLGSALASGRLVPGASAAMLRTLGLPAVWSGLLASLGEGGWTASTLAEAVELALLARRKAASRIDVVSTHPGVASAGLSETAVVLRQLFEQAKQSVLLAGFRITDRELLERLRRRDAQRLDITVYLHFRRGENAWGFRRGPGDEGYEDSAAGCWRQFCDRIWPEAMGTPRGFYSPAIYESSGSGMASMHAKCAIVDGDRVFISSANFTDAAQYRNVELGVRFDDARVAERILRHFDGMVQGGAFATL